MRVSLYTFVKDGIRLDYHVVQMLKYHAKLFDEIVVVEGYSRDGTYEAIRDIDPKIKIIRKDLGRQNELGVSWTANAKDAARQACTGDWCVLLDSDEFFPAWELERLRKVIQSTDKVMLPVQPLHFYANYKIHQIPAYAIFGHRIHRNLPDIEVWGDGMNVRLRGGEWQPYRAEDAFEIHHFGEVRRPARLREKWRAQGRRHKKVTRADWMPSFLFDLFPHQWCKPGLEPLLRIYNGPYIEAVLEDPEEFVRDNFQVYDWVCKYLSRVESADCTAEPGTCSSATASNQRVEAAK